MSTFRNPSRESCSLLVLLLVAAVQAASVQAAGEDKQPGANVKLGGAAAKSAGKAIQLADPEITGVLPFSSCTPGGSVILKGENLGSQPGTLRLVGHFPGPYVELTQLEWTNHSIGGKVPSVSGALDQEVSIQAVRKDGKPSNTWKCQFTGNRVTKKVQSQVVKTNVCYLGENAGQGCAADGDPDVAKQIVAGCWHSNNSCGLPTDRGLHGQDEIRIKRLENGWRFKKVMLGQPMFENTEKRGVHEIHGKLDGQNVSWGDVHGGANEFSVDGTVMTLLVPWEVPRGDIIHYNFSFEIEGPEGIPFDEVVSLPSKEQTLTDWNPIAPTGDAEVTIVAPAEGAQLVASAGQFELSLNAATPQPDWRIELEWIRLGAGKDPSIEKYTTPAGAPKEVGWTQLPRQVSVADLGGPGRYAVRAKVKGSPGDTWTSYRHFTLVGTISSKPLVAPGGLGAAEGSKKLDVKPGQVQRLPGQPTASPKAAVKAPAAARSPKPALPKPPGDPEAAERLQNALGR